MRRILFWTLFAVTFGLSGVMMVWSLPAVSAAAGGLAPFDMRPGGYGFDEAHAFLSALTADGNVFYRTIQQRLDIPYPALISLLLFFSIAALLPRRLAAARYVVALPALAIAVFDYLENHAVAGLLLSGAGTITPQMVAEASQWTVLKSVASTLVMSAVLVLLLWRGGVAAYRWLRPVSRAA